jgi:hypothetical protein
MVHEQMGYLFHVRPGVKGGHGERVRL